MNILFENRYTRDEEWMKEALSHLHFSHPRAIVGYVLGALFLLVGIIAWLWYGIFPFYSLVFNVVFWISKYSMFRKALRTSIAQDLENNQGQPISIQIDVFSDSVRIARIGANFVSIPLSSVKKVAQTPNLILLYTKAKQILFFHRYGFIQGTAQEFIQFLKTQGIKVK